MAEQMANPATSTSPPLESSERDTTNMAATLQDLRDGASNIPYNQDALSSFGLTKPSHDSGYLSLISTASSSKSKSFSSDPRLEIFNKEIPDNLRERFLDIRVLYTQPLWKVLSGRRHGNPGDISMKLKYFGRSEQDAELCILIQCDKRVSKKVKRFFAQKHVLEDLQPHFRVHVIDTGLIQLSEGDLVTVRGNLAAPSGTWCGMAIEMSVGGVSRIATFGGLVMVLTTEKTLYGLTASHPLATICQDLLDETKSWEDSDESTSDGGSDTDSHVGSRTYSDSGQFFGQNEEEVEQGISFTASSDIGTIIGDSIHSKKNLRNLDWALIKLHPKYWAPNLLSASPSILKEGSTELAEEALQRENGSGLSLFLPKTPPSLRSQNAVVLTSRGFQRGTLSSNRSGLLMSPGRIFVETFDFLPHIESRLKSGDSGSWVVNEITGEVYGHVVSIDAIGEAFVMPVQSTLLDIQTHLGASKVSLPTPEEVFELQGTQESSTSTSTVAEAPGFASRASRSIPNSLPAVNQNEINTRYRELSFNIAGQLPTAPSRMARRRSSSPQNATPMTEQANDSPIGMPIEIYSHLNREQSVGLIAASLSARLERCGEEIYQDLVDQFRRKNAREFPDLYSAFHDIHDSCESFRKFATVEQEEISVSESAKMVTNAPFSSFMLQLSQKIQSGVLNLLSEIRSNPEFLVTRICGLSEYELDAFTKSRTTFFRHAESIAPIKFKESINSKAQPPKPEANPFSFQRYDPLHILINIIFATPCSPGSPEDLRRTDIWATVCSGLISTNKRGGLELFIHVFDIFASKGLWPAKAKFETFLMDTLQTGQFLLDVGEGIAPGSGLSSRTAFNEAQQYAAEEFFNSSVEKLFELLNNEPRTAGLPEGVLDIATAMFQKTGSEPALKHRAETTILYRWFFSSYLTNALRWPESHGMMLGYHISEKARHVIFGEIASRVIKQVWESLNARHDQNTESAKINLDLERILDRVKNRNRDREHMGQKTKETLQIPKTVETQPCLVICPSDIVTLINALFPEKHRASIRAAKTFGREDRFSDASSISSVAFSANSVSTGWDNRSTLSTKATSIMSDSVLRRPSLESMYVSYNRVYESNSEQGPLIIPATSTEEYGVYIQQLCLEMQRVLGSQICSGTCHPCEERWEVLYISSNGKRLTTRMRRDGEDNESQVQTSDVTGSDETSTEQKTGLELAHPADSENRPEDSSLHSGNQRQENSLQSLKMATFSRSNLEAVTNTRLAENRVFSNQAQMQRKLATSERQILSTFQDLETYFVWFKEVQKCHRVKINDMERRFKSLRTKMWYYAVLTSPSYDEARNVATVLKWMNQPAPLSDNPIKLQQKLRKARTFDGFLVDVKELKSIMAADPTTAGSNKLSDEQSDLTSTWLSTRRIENLCVGEERIHRFCLAIEKCIEKLVGENISDAPVLWSSDLFVREREIFARQRETEAKPLSQAGFVTSHISSEGEYGADTLYRSMKRGPVLVPPISKSKIWSKRLLRIQSNDSSPVEGDKKRFLLDLKQTLLGLLLSDLGSIVFPDGSETDLWLASDIGVESLQRKEAENRRQEFKLTESKKSDSGNGSSLLKPPYHTAARSLFRDFGVQPNPFDKLAILQQLDLLIRTSLSLQAEHITQHTKTGSKSTENTMPESAHVAENEVVVERLRILLSDPEIGTKTLFRDVQYISALVPAHILDKTASGAAFWNLSLAALGLKQEVCQSMVEIAEEIVHERFSQREQQTVAPSSATLSLQADVRTNQTQNKTNISPSSPRRTMSDAAQRFIIAAKEGDAVAARELAIFYLTSPDDTPRTLPPLSLPKEIFVGNVEQEQISMRLAQHWMERSRQAGDELAAKYLTQKEDLSKD